jgi:hypothetical protein
LNPETIDRVIEEALREFGPGYTALLDEFSAYLKDLAIDRTRGASLSFRLGMAHVSLSREKNIDLASITTPFKLMALISLKQGDDAQAVAAMRDLVFPSVWDRLMQDD